MLLLLLLLLRLRLLFGAALGDGIGDGLVADMCFSCTFARMEGESSPLFLCLGACMQMLLLRLSFGAAFGDCTAEDYRRFLCYPSCTRRGGKVNLRTNIIAGCSFLSRRYYRIFVVSCRALPWAHQGSLTARSCLLFPYAGAAIGADPIAGLAVRDPFHWTPSVLGCVLPSVVQGARRFVCVCVHSVPQYTKSVRSRCFFQRDLSPLTFVSPHCESRFFYVYRTRYLAALFCGPQDRRYILKTSSIGL